MKEQREEIYYERGLPVPETPLPGQEPKPWGKTHVVGKPLPRIDAYQRVSGAAIYPSDVTFPDMLYGAILRCPHPHARVESVATTEAERMSGVFAVITGKTPEANVKWPYQQGVKTKLFDPICRFEGEAVAAVAADRSTGGSTVVVRRDANPAWVAPLVSFVSVVAIGLIGYAMMKSGVPR